MLSANGLQAVFKGYWGFIDLFHDIFMIQVRRPLFVEFYSDDFDLLIYLQWLPTRRFGRYCRLL